MVSTQGFESCGGGLDLPKTSIKFATLGQYLSKTEVGNKRLVKFCSSFFYGRHDTAKWLWNYQIFLSEQNNLNSFAAKIVIFNEAVII